MSDQPTTTPSEVLLFNTLTRRKERLDPIEPGKVGMYCCGPTVYNFAHIGNMRAYLFEDILRRTLETAGYKVKHVMNVTDVGHLTSDADAGEDKMMVAMRREGRSAQEIADFYSEAFFRHTAMLNIKRPTIVCQATKHIPEMIRLIERLEANGLAYEAGGNIFFDIAKFPAYGVLTGQNLDDLQAGARIEVDSAKHNPHDFALWFTRSKFENQEMNWESPWGRGYPGWHIECSAMSMKYLGEQFDIHCGGIDHVPVHHTNEIAQSEGATGKSPWVRVWMHNEFLITDKEKMSKSSGQFTTVDTLKEKGYDPLAFRYLCLGAQYRQKLGFGYEALDGAASGLDRLRRVVLTLREAGAPATLDPTHPRLVEFRECIFDDLNTSRALALAWTVARDESPTSERLALLYAFDDVLGLGLKDYVPAPEKVPEEILHLVEQRQAARKAKDFAESDRLRDTW
jgi:cysteinyl-tRNA synthetase